MRMTRTFLAFAATIALATVAQAHRQWLLPSATTLSGTDSWVTVDIAASNDVFFADHAPGRLESVEVWKPDGTQGEIQNGATGRYRSVFDVKIDQPGTWKIGTSQSGIMGSFKVDGVEWRVGGRRGPPPGAAGQRAPGAAGAAPGGPAGAGGEGRQAPRFVNSVDEIPANATDVQLTEMSGQNIVFVTADAPTETVFQPTGKGLEMVPVTHPDELVQGEAARFRFLVDGQPAADLPITIVPGGKRYREAEGAFEVRTGADGVVTIDWPVAGMMWLNAALSDDKPSNPRATSRRMSYTATLEVMAP